ncbi:MAG: gamma-glutamyltransferase family protein [Bryobacteraceae bacterium]|jgi:gamma-glutamyltranspeptidase/glutathione hydrolase
MKYKPAVLFFGLVAICAAQRKDFEQPAMRPARGTKGAVACGSEYAAEAGMRIYFHGGNAVDAGVATMFAASVSEFSHFGLGGEAPILIRTKAGKIFAIAGVGTMPKMATAEFFRDRRPKPGEILTMEPGGLKGIIPVAGIMPALVPSMVDAGLVALRDFGSKSFAEEIQPAIELADGLPIDEMRAGSIARSRRFFELWPDSKNTFLPDGQVPMPGEIFRQPNLAKTLRAMAAAEKKALASGASRVAAIDAVRDFFYRGDIAHRIDTFMRANDGLLRYEDMAAFKLEPEEPVSTDYHGYKVYKPGFWSQGPAMIEALNILEGYDLRSLGANSTEYIHKLVEALKLAYADRDTYYGDPKFNHIPTDVLLSKTYAAERRKQIGHNASLDFVPGTINGKQGRHPTEMEIARTKIDDELMASDTTCVDAIDKDGMVFSATPSGSWLPSVIAGDTGIPLTERAQQFILVEGSPNELAGGKRPRVTLSPTIVTEQGKPFLALSTPGGDNQEQSLIQLLFNVVEFGMNAQAAIEAPRFQTRHLVSSFDNHAWNRGDLLLDERIPAATGAELSARGHRVGTRSRWSSGAAPVMVHIMPDGVIEAGADPYGYRVAHAY